MQASGDAGANSKFHSAVRQSTSSQLALILSCSSARQALKEEASRLLAELDGSRAGVDALYNDEMPSY